MPIQFPRRRTRSNAVAGAIVSGSNVALRLMELKQRERISGEKTAASETRAQTERVQGAARVATGRKQAATAAERLVETKAHNVETERLARQKFTVENADRLPFTAERTTKLDQTFTLVGAKTPKALTNILNTHVAAGSNAGAVYDDLSIRWDGLTETAADDLQGQYDKGIKDGTILVGSEKANNMINTITELRQDGSSKRILNMLFSNTREARAARTAEKAGFSAPFLRDDVEVQRGPTGRILATPTKKAPPTTATPEERKLNKIASRFQNASNQYNSATRGVGRFIEDPNKERIAKESFVKSLNLAVDFKKNGGDPNSLGITPETIQGAVAVGIITKDKAISISKILWPEGP